MSVHYRARALEDMAAIYEWRVRQSVELAESIEAAIFAAAEWLGDHQKFGTMTDEADVRRWPMTDFRYTIFYWRDPEGQAIDVLRVIPGKQVGDLKRVPR